MKNFVKTGALLLVAAVLMLAGCKQDETVALGTGAGLTRITVGGKTADQTPTAITAADWNDEEHLLFPADWDPDGEVYIIFKTSDELAGAAIQVAAAQGAKVAYALSPGRNNNKSAITFTPSVEINGAFRGFLYIRVTPENNSSSGVRYYRIGLEVEGENTTIMNIRVGPADDTTNYVQTSPGASAASWNEVTVPGTLSLSGAQKTGVVITVNKQDADATVEYAVTKNATDAPNFSSTNTGFDLENGDIIYLKVTAANEVTVVYYKINVEVGTNATLAGFRIGNTLRANEAYLGVPGATIAEAQEGSYQVDTYTDPLAVRARTTDSEATVGWCVVDGPNAPAGTYESIANDNTGTATTTSDDIKDKYVYVEVVSGNGNVKLYYKLKIILPVKETVFYGVPKLDAPGADLGSGKYIDSMWDAADVAVFDVSRVNQAESEYGANPWFHETWGQHTSATAKLLWDDAGLWVLADIDFHDFKREEDGTTVSRTASLSPTGTGSHLYDSVEVFINERLPGNSGRRQYRIGADNLLTQDGVPTGPQAAFLNGGNTRAWLKDNNEGYYVVALIPWPETAAQSTVRDTGTGLVTNGPDAVIGLELQVNACSVDGGREGILTWNGITTQAYGSTAGYGQVILEMGAGRNRVVQAEQPAISAHPADATYETGTTAASLSVTATASGTLSYQWWSADSATGEGAAIDGATEATYTPDEADIGTPTSGEPVVSAWYWVVVTNTDTAADVGYQVASSISNKARINFTMPRVYVSETITLGSGAFALFKFELPDGAEWGDFEKITVDYMVDADNLAKQIRQDNTVRLMGNYFLSEIPTSTDAFERLAINIGGTGMNAEKIIDNAAKTWDTMGAAADTWFTVEYSIDGTVAHGSFAAANKPADDDTGPFWFAVGIPGIDSDVPADAITQEVKNVTLVAKSGDAGDNVVSKGSGYEEALLLVNTTRENAAGVVVSNRIVHWDD